jgi:NAD(P)H-hydrate epimerase
LRSLGQPLVLDADGLYALVGHLDLLAGRTAPTVITPHEGEAARLLGLGADDVRRDREEAAARLAAETGAVVVLKGPGTLVTDGRRLFRSGTGGPVLASGGTGDVLAGVVGAFLAGLPGTGGDPFGAAAAAVHVHGAAADRLGTGLDRGVLASEVAAALPQAVATLVGTGGGTEGTS